MVVLSAGLLYGTLVHWVDLIVNGWHPRPDLGTPANVIWTSLAVLDPLALALLWPTRTRRVGVILTLLIVTVDVPLNLWAQRRTGTEWPLGGIAQPLTAFALVAVAGAPLLWRSVTDLGSGAPAPRRTVTGKASGGRDETVRRNPHPAL